MTRRDALAWLAYRAHEAEIVGEGELADLLGVDRIEARDVLIAGRDLDDARTAARKARVDAMRAEVGARKADAATVGADGGPRGYRVVGDILTRLFADGRERTTGEAAKAMGVTPSTAAQRLRRSLVVARVAQGRWRLRGAA